MAPHSDSISITGLAATGFHGVLEHEKRDGQPFIVDLVLHVDTSAAAATDDLTKTVHYGLVAERVHEIVTGEQVELIETLAERIAAAVLAEFTVSGLEVTVHKPRAPIEVVFSDVMVHIYRERP